MTRTALDAIPRHRTASAAASDPSVEALLELAEGLQRVGTSPGLVEELLAEVSDGLGIRGRFFAMPTGVCKPA